MTVIRVGEIELDYERSGTGPPLLMIMGMSGTALSWGEPFLAELRRDFDVIAYDHRGVGASSRLQDPITIGHLFFLERPQRAAELLRAHAAVHA
jgi:3-oxoadipate enol-lactonase